MRVAVLYNPTAGSVPRSEAFLEGVRRSPEMELLDIRKDSENAIERASRGELDLLLIAGGDGTLHTFLKKLGSREREKVRIGLIPLGTGNDFARTLGIPLDPDEALAAALDGGDTRVDLLLAEGQDRIALCANLATGGLGGLTEQNVDPAMKARWRSLTYLRSAAETALDPPVYEVVIKLPQAEPLALRAINVVIANGRTEGGGFAVAPSAHPQDSFADVVIVHPAPITRLAQVATRLLAGDYTQSEDVTHFRTREIEIHASPGMPFSVDGNEFSRTPIRFRVLPMALQVRIPRSARA